MPQSKFSFYLKTVGFAAEIYIVPLKKELLFVPGGLCANGKRQSRKEYHSTEFYFPIEPNGFLMQMVNNPASPADFAGADDIITNLAKEREPGIDIIGRTPQSLIMHQSIPAVPIPPGQ